VHDDVERLLAEVLREPAHQAVDGEVANLLVTLARAQLFGRVAERVERRVERVDLLEVEHAPIAEPARPIHLPALEQIEKDVERRRPRADRDAGPRLGERLGDREAIAAVIGHAGDECAAAREIDVEHARDIASEPHRGKGRSSPAPGCARRSRARSSMRTPP
jgi:hypothetical protein